MSSMTLLDTCGRRRSPATLSSFHQGRPPRNKGRRYPADPPTVEEIIAVMRAAGEDADAVRLPGLIVVLWRAGLRISEALALTERDLDPARGAILVRKGKGGKRREVGMDRWAWGQLGPWLQLRATLPVGALFCVLRGPTRGHHGHRPPSGPNCITPPARAGVRRRFAPHQLRHAHAVEMSREGVPLLVIQQQLGHADLAITSVYLRGIDNTGSFMPSMSVRADDPGHPRAEALRRPLRWVVRRTTHLNEGRRHTGSEERSVAMRSCRAGPPGAKAILATVANGR